MNINKRFREEDANNDSTRLQPVTKKLIPFPKSSAEVPPVAQEPAIPYGTFFTSRIINNFNQRINNGKLTIMNLEQLLGKMNEINGNREYQNKILLQQLLPKLVCKNMGKAYTEETIERGIKPAEYLNYDSCFLINTQTNNINEMFKGFLVVQRAECAKYPNVYCLKLVCALEQGHLLVGCYLYTILNHPNLPADFNKIKLYPIVKNQETPLDKIGLLEMSASYENISALCLYTKFGFKEDKSLRGYYSNCFREENNLPMIIDLTKVSEDKIIKIIKKEDEGFQKHIICQITDKKLQKLLGYLYKIRDKRMQELTKNKDDLELQRKLTNINRDITSIESNKAQSIESSDHFKEMYENIFES